MVGSLEIQVGGNVLFVVEVVERLIIEVFNWECILEYYCVELVLFYQFCVEEYDVNQFWFEVQFYNLEDEYKQGLGVFG